MIRTWKGETKNMEDLLTKIYKSVVCNESDSVRAGEKYDYHVNQLIEQYADKMNEEEVEFLGERIYDVAYVIEFGGFVLGVQFAMKFMSEVQSGIEVL